MSLAIIFSANNDYLKKVICFAEKNKFRITNNKNILLLILYATIIYRVMKTLVKFCLKFFYLFHQLFEADQLQ